MRLALLCLLLATQALAAAPGYRRVTDARMWISAELPAGWDAEGPTTHAFRPRTGREEIVVSFVDDADPLKYVELKADPTPAQRDARRIAEFRASTPEHRGPWVLVETYEKSATGAVERAVEAAAPAPGGAIYACSFWAADPAVFQRDRAVFERWLDTFRRDYPAPKFARYQGKGFSLEAPAGPWDRRQEPQLQETYFQTPLGPDGFDTLKIQWFDGNPLFKDAGQFAKDEGRSAPGHKAGPISQRRLPAGDALTWDVEVLAEQPKFPERQTGDRRSLYRWAVIQHGARFVAVSWSASPSGFGEGLPVFERALRTLRFEP